MAYAFVQNPSVALSDQAEKPHDRRVLIIGPESMSLEELIGLKDAFTRNECAVNAFRTDAQFKLRDLQTLVRTATHLLLVLDREDDAREREILLAVDATSSAKVVLLCLHSSQALRRFARRIHEDSVQTIIVRSHAEHAQLRRDGVRTTVFVVDAADLSKSVKDIVRAVVGRSH